MDRIVTVILFLLLFTYDGRAQQSNSKVGKDSPSSESIKEEYTLDKRQFDLFKKEMELKILETTKEKELHKKEIDLKIEEYKQEKTVLDWIAITVGGITFLSLFGFWQRVKSMAQKRIEERFEVILQEKKGQLIKIIDSHDDEEKLKRTKKIKVVASSESDVTFLNSFFKKFDFKHIELLELDEDKDLDEIGTDFDLLFLNREEGNNPIGDEIALKLVKDSPQDSIVFSFGGGFINIKEEKDKKRFAAASNWSQLYGNLISALKYQELIDIK